MIFVDTGAFLARHLQADQHHDAAVTAWQEIATGGERLATTNLVVGELLTLLARRTSSDFAAERGRLLYESSALSVLRPSESDEVQAMLLLNQYGPQGSGFVDCVSFAMMRRHSISVAFTFDHHFAEAGFETIPTV